jgi:hypothetical protein
VGSLRGDKGRKSSEMLCKTPIVFDDEYSAMNIPNRATANETRSPNYNGTPFSLGISLSHREAKASTA